MKSSDLHTRGPSIFLIATVLSAFVVPLLLTDSVVTALITTPLQQAVSVGLAACIVLGVCYWSVPRVTVDGADAVGGEN